MRYKVYFLLITVFLLLIIKSSLSLDFTLKPVKLYIYPNKTTAVFEIQSLANYPIAVETEAYIWEQNDNGKEILTPTENLIVVPPYIELKPKERQLVRVAYTGTFEKPQEFYRIFLRQIPQDFKPPKNPTKIETRIQVLLNISFPVFVIKDKDAYYKLSAKVNHISKEKIILYISNKGNGYAKIRKVIFMKGNKKLLEKNFVQYVFPQKEIKVTFNFVNKEENKQETHKSINSANTITKLEELPDKIVLILENDEKHIISAQ